MIPKFTNNKKTRRHIVMRKMKKKKKKMMDDFRSIKCCFESFILNETRIYWSKLKYEQFFMLFFFVLLKTFSRRSKCEANDGCVCVCEWPKTESESSVSRGMTSHRTTNCFRQKIKPFENDDNKADDGGDAVDRRRQMC